MLVVGHIMVVGHIVVNNSFKVVHTVVVVHNFVVKLGLNCIDLRFKLVLEIHIVVVKVIRNLTLQFGLIHIVVGIMVTFRNLVE